MTEHWQGLKLLISEDLVLGAIPAGLFKFTVFVGFMNIANLNILANPLVKHSLIKINLEKLVSGLGCVEHCLKFILEIISTSARQLNSIDHPTLTANISHGGKI